MYLLTLKIFLKHLCYNFFFLSKQDYVDVYFERIKSILSNTPESHIRLLLEDLVALRQNRWFQTSSPNLDSPPSEETMAILLKNIYIYIITFPW